MGLPGYPKMSVTSYQPAMHYIPQKQRPPKYFGLYTSQHLFHIRQDDGYMCCVKKSFIAAQVLDEFRVCGSVHLQSLK